MCGITPTDEQRVYYYVLWPTTFLSIHPDYLLVHRLVPVDSNHTQVVCDWLFEGETIDGEGFDPSDAIAFWDLTNRQDWHVCELQQRGTASRSWVAGRYSNQEASVQAFDLMVADRYAEDGVASQRAVRERYSTPPPKPDHERAPTAIARRSPSSAARAPPRPARADRAPALRRRCARRSPAGRRGARPNRQARKIRIAVIATMIVEIALISGVTPNRIFE